MGVSTGNHQLIRRIFPNLMKLLGLIELFISSILVKKSLIFASVFPAKHAKYVFSLLSFLQKFFFPFSKNLMLLYENSLKLYILGNILNPRVKLHRNLPTEKIFKTFLGVLDLTESNTMF